SRRRSARSRALTWWSSRRSARRRSKRCCVSPRPRSRKRFGSSACCPGTSTAWTRWGAPKRSCSAAWQWP
ncbi:unnamed protein product, partial [Effrenium voratum]